MYTAFLVSAFQTRLAYRSKVWALLLSGLITVFAKIAIWLSLYAQAGAIAVNDVSLAEMTTYAILAGFVLNWKYQRFLRTFGRQVKSGDVSVFLLKPVRFPLMLLACECGDFAFELVTVQLPVTIAAGLVYGLVAPASWSAGAMAIIFWVTGFIILFLLSAIAAVMSFWLLTIFSLEWGLMAVITISAGGLVPLWFFPAGVANVIQLLPFSFIAFHPMGVYLGKVDGMATLYLFGVAVAWVIVLTACFALLWKRAQNRIMVHGG